MIEIIASNVLQIPGKGQILQKILQMFRMIMDDLLKNMGFGITNFVKI